MLQPAIGVFSNNSNDIKEIKTSISVFESKMLGRVISCNPSRDGRALFQRQCFKV